jgi:hypothetical protein
VDDKNKGKSANSYEILGYVVIGVGLVLILLGLVLFNFLGHASKLSDFDIQRYGQFGQFIGGIVGSLWALAGVLLFFATLTYQKKEFEQQRIELEKTQKIFKQQDFSSLFLNIISQHNSYVNSLVAWGDDQIAWKGSNFFALFKHKVLESFELKSSEITKQKFNGMLMKDYFAAAFLEQYNIHQHELEPYFKNIKLLFEMVHKYRNETLDKSDYYSHILKSSISNNELFLIYHAAALNVFTDLKKYHRVFNLFEYLDHDSRVEYIVEKRSKEIFPFEAKDKPKIVPTTDEVIPSL